jgi:hypothetical protein
MVKPKNNQSASKEDKRKVILVKLMAPVSQLQNRIRDTIVILLSSLREKKTVSIFY